MNLSGTSAIAAPPDVVFARLTDPVVLKGLIPGCEKMECVAPGEYQAELKLGLAAIKGAYSGKVKLTDVCPGKSFTMHVEGKGMTGFVKGSTRIELTPQGSGTVLGYQANMHVGGLIAAVGSRMIEAAGRKMTDEFFKKFAESLDK